MKNYGVHIGGNSTVNAGAIAGGPGAVAINSPSALDKLRTALGDLEQVVSAPLSDPATASVADAREAVQEARVEAAKDTPDKGRLMSFLGRVTAGAGTVSQVAAAVTAVEAALQAVM